VLVTFDAVYVYVVKEKPIFIDDDILLGYSEAVVACYSAACRVSENVFIFFPPSSYHRNRILYHRAES
jgi:hypothetical protein